VYFCCSQLSLIGFGWYFSPDKFSTRCFFGCVRLARSNFTAFRLPASETVIGRGQCSATDAAASATPSGEFAGARPGIPTSAFGKHAGSSSSSASLAT
jgi:hypothetical protein